MDLKEKNILITGGSAGIGLETAKMLKSTGAQVIINARNRDRLEAAAKQHGLLTVPGDVSKEDDVKKNISFHRAEIRRIGCTDQQCRVRLFRFAGKHQYRKI